MREIVKDKLFEKVGYKPHSKGQEEFHNSTARFKVPVCGRRYGKTTMAAHEALPYLFMPGTRGWICGATYDLAEKEFRVLYNIIVHILRLGKDVKKSYNKRAGEMWIEMPWGSMVEVRSASKPESLVGEGLDWVIMSEAAKHQKQTWDQFIRPALSDKRGVGIFPTTPQGFNWIHKMYQIAQDPKEPNYWGVRLPSWENPVVYPGGREDPEILLMERTVPEEWFKQEIAADFTTVVGQYYPEFQEETHVTDVPYNPLWPNYLAVDFGFTHPFVALDIQMSPEGAVYVWREYYQRNLPTYEHGIYLRDRPSPMRYVIKGGVGDVAAADGLATLASILGFQFFAQQSEVNAGIMEIKKLLKVQSDGKPRLFIDRSCENLIRELQCYRKRPRGRTATSDPKDEPLKKDDHAPDALRYFVAMFYLLGGAYSLTDMAAIIKHQETESSPDRGIFVNTGSSSYGQEF